MLAISPPTGRLTVTSPQSATETLDTYDHLWPDSDDETRSAVDHVLSNLLGASPSGSGLPRLGEEPS